MVLLTLSALFVATIPAATLPVTPVQEARVAPAGARAAPAVQELGSEQLQDHIDTSLRWLRTQQQREDGSYGGVEATAWVLRAYLESPRGYHVGDGPFLSRGLGALVANQRADGAIADAGAVAQEVLAQTLAAARALALMDEEPALTALDRAEAFLGVPSVVVPEPTPLDADQARRLANGLLAQRSADGAWEGHGGSTLSTARNVVQLCDYYRAIRRAEPKPAAAVSEPLPAAAPADRGRGVAALQRGAAFLVENVTGEGLWGALGTTDPGITAMVVGALLTVPQPRGEAVEGAIERGLEYLVSLQRQDGSIHTGALANYVTSASVLALARAGREEHRPVLEAARNYLVELQSDEGEGYGPSDRYYGGVGYGGDERPDLSNLQLALEALEAAGLQPGDETYQKAVVFLQRTQNRSESNDLQLVEGGVTLRPGNDGGAGYAPGESKAGFVELPDGTKVPRSYGSMTYALLRGYLFAGLTREDPRVAAAYEWIRNHYTLDVNPGFEAGSNSTAPYQGLFYYFYSLAKALDTLGEEQLVDGAGVSHAWRAELAGRLLSIQRQDGSWINVNSPRWWEGNPVLATAYAMLSMDVALRGAGIEAPAAGTPPVAGDGHDHEHR
jgi:squalene-hopene/tetraprenyl-beta-curcumene cyclase